VTKVTEHRGIFAQLCIIINKSKEIMTEEMTYQIDLKWNEGRIGTVSSPNLDQAITCATPPEFNGGVPNIWSPEHFYGAAINSCFMTTFLAIAEMSRVAFESFECKTIINLKQIERKYMITQAEISPVIKLADPEKDSERISKVLEKTKANCLVTNSMKTEVTIIPTIL